MVQFELRIFNGGGVPHPRGWRVGLGFHAWVSCLGFMLGFHGGWRGQNELDFADIAYAEKIAL